jgi:hypothetical protein
LPHLWIYSIVSNGAPIESNEVAHGLVFSGTDNEGPFANGFGQGQRHIVPTGNEVNESMTE